MDSINRLAIRYHRQDEYNFCGAACAQMVLRQIGAPLLDQSALYPQVHAGAIESGWFAAPDALVTTLQNNRPTSFTNDFKLFAETNKDILARKLVWTIHHYQVAPIALVFSYQHWLVVRGCCTSAPPANETDNSYTIKAFFLHNPLADDSSPPPPPPHSATDGCGAGGYYGVQDKHVTYQKWRTTYALKVLGGHWDNQFLAVCDPAPAPAQPGNIEPFNPMFRGDKLIRAKTAIEQAIVGLREEGLIQLEGWAEALQNTTPQTPTLVQRLDEADQFYYLVPMENDHRVTTVIACVNARYGNYEEAILASKGASLLTPSLTRQQILGLVIGKRFVLPGNKGIIMMRKESATLSPTLVWKPCRESFSPFLPFYVVTSGTNYLYVRIDGQVFTNLHDTERGI